MNPVSQYCLCVRNEVGTKNKNKPKYNNAISNSYDCHEKKKNIVGKMCYGMNVCVSPNIHMLKSSSQCDAIR